MAGRRERVGLNAEPHEGGPIRVFFLADEDHDELNIGWFDSSQLFA
jgi:hypothetical protein